MGDGISGSAAAAGRGSSRLGRRLCRRAVPARDERLTALPDRPQAHAAVGGGWPRNGCARGAARARRSLRLEPDARSVPGAHGTARADSRPRPGGGPSGNPARAQGLDLSIRCEHQRRAVAAAQGARRASRAGGAGRAGKVGIAWQHWIPIGQRQDDGDRSRRDLPDRRPPRARADQSADLLGSGVCG